MKATPPIRLLSLLCAATALSFPLKAQAQTVLPSGASVVDGPVAISRPDPQSMKITQKDNLAKIDWTSFSISADARVDIKQPNADSILINRVTGDTKSQIDGALTANGEVFLINPNGITIGKTGKVTANGFVASTLNLNELDPKGRTVDLLDLTVGDVSVSGTLQGSGTNSYIVLAGGNINLWGADLKARSIALAAFGRGGGDVSLTLPGSTSGLTISDHATSAGSAINITGKVETTANGALVLSAGALADAVINVDGTVIVNDGTAVITVGEDRAAVGLRVGQATKSRPNKIAPGKINFIGNRSKNSLNINNADYRLIWNVDDFLAIGKPGNDRQLYALAADLDFKNKIFKDALIRYPDVNFAGALNGLGHSLSNISIQGDGATDAQIGIFDTFGLNQNIALDPLTAPSIGNLVLLGLNVTKEKGPSSGSEEDPQAYVGGLVGSVGRGLIYNVYVNGAINVDSSSFVGGLAGQSYGLIRDSAADIAMTTAANVRNSQFRLGGLVGLLQPDARIDGSFVRGTLRGVSYAPNVEQAVYIGGLVGHSDGIIADSGAQVDITDSYIAGGLSGSISRYASILRSQYRGVIRNAYSYAGGLAGIAAGGVISDSSATADLKAGGETYVSYGGLVGAMSALTITNSAFSGSITAGADSEVGGIAGAGETDFQGTAYGISLIENVFVSATLTAGPRSYVGGVLNYVARVSGALVNVDLMAGENSMVGGIYGMTGRLGEVTNSFASGTIIAGRKSFVGGIVGCHGCGSAGNGGRIEGVISDMDIVAGENSMVGGITGDNRGKIANSLALGTITTGAGSLVGGISGYLQGNAIIQNSLYVKDGNQQPAQAVGKTASGGQLINTKAVTSQALKTPSVAQPILGTTYFSYPANKAPTLKRAPGRKK